MSQLIEKIYKKITPARKRRFEYANLIGEYIYTLLDKLGKTQKEFAKELDMKPSQLSRYINGEANMNLETIARFEIALNEKIIHINRSEKSSAGRFVTAMVDNYMLDNSQDFRLLHLRSSFKDSRNKTRQENITKEVNSDSDLVVKIA